MNRSGSFQLYGLRAVLVLSFCLPLCPRPALAAAPANNYCIKPPFISLSVPPMVMFEVGRDHKLYYEAYNDGVDLNGDGRIDRTYDHSIDYYGYFNPYKCYTPASGATQNDYFTPVATTADKFCASGQWGGNILNWMSMSRMDVLRKVMYGGQRSSESPRILLDRAYIPQDAHSWGKEYTGRLCYNATSGVYKNMCYADADCDTDFTCTDKSINLLGMVKPTGGDICSDKSISWGTATQGANKLLVVRYPNPTGKVGSDHSDIMAAFDTTQFYSGFSPQYVTDFGDAILKPTDDHGNKYAEAIVSEFQVAAGEGGVWSFAIDGDDGVELVIKTTASVVVNPASTTATSPWIAYYGTHGAAGDQSHFGTYNLTEATWYRMIVRHTENTGNDGVRVWFKKPGGTQWKYYGNRTSAPTLTVRAPDIVLGNNDCTLKTSDFVQDGTPENTGVASSPQTRHLICNTTLSSGVPTTDRATSILRLITNSNHRIWEWASKERPVCDDTFTDGSSATTNRTDYTVQVEVCKAGVGTLSMDDRFERCRSYGGTFDAGTKSYSGGSYVPVGLFQKYGEVEFDDAGNEIKVCSKTMGKTCNVDNDCGAGEGLCFTKAPMYFGLFTTSYSKNTSGGVLRKNPGPVFDEVVNTNGKMQTSENERGNLINSINRLKIIDFDYGTHSYSNCGWITNRPMGEGECKMWGNPIAEMMYESIRYFAGKGTTAGGGETSDFNYATTADSGVSLSKPKWGYNKGSTYYKPFEIFPSCSQPFLLLLSDVNTSFDSDQIPGSSYTKPDGTTFTEDAATPQLGLGSVQTSGKTLLNELTDFIGQVEGINGNSWFIGESGGSTDFICSAKSVANLSAVRGMCPEEPTKRGSYYAAALAYYGKTRFSAIAGSGALSTFVVAMSSPFADIKVKAGNGFVTVVPVGKSVYGGGVDKCIATGYCSLTTAADGNNRLTGCPTTAFCPTNSLVDFYIDDMKYDSSNNLIYSKFRINFEDVEQGADHDMDAIASYELCTQDAATAHYGSCTGTISGLQVKVKSEYAAGGIAQLLGFIVSGTTEDGTYLVIKDVDTGSGAISGLPIEWNKTFTVSSSGTGNYLKNPLWYAAKWGGFTGSSYPQVTSQWDKNNDGLPDTYFPVSNPLQLDEQLEKALNEILARVASGTAASILNNSEGSGANLLQAVFYPKKEFDATTQADWIGEIQNLWYFIDPFLQKTSIREDTDQNNTLNLKSDRVAQFYFDAGQNKTLVKRFADADGDGAADTPGTPLDTVSPDDVKSLWKAGRMLWERETTDPRIIYTHTGIAGLDDATTKFTLLDATSGTLTADATFQGMLQLSDATKTAKLINYIKGFDQVPDSDGTKYRGRRVTILGCGVTTNNAKGCSLAPTKVCAADTDCVASTEGTCITLNNTAQNKCTREWRLGDIVSSTPKLVSTVALNSYNQAAPRGYGDNTYLRFTSTTPYTGRGMVFAGGNDGMLHAFKLGILKEVNDRFTKAKLVNADGSVAAMHSAASPSTSDLGREAWAFVPQNSLPYLQYLSDPNYSHLYYIDKTPAIADVSIGTPVGCTSDYSLCTKVADGSTWRTIIIGGMGFGGAAKANNDACVTPACVKTPSATTAAVGNPAATAHVGYSSYFALDVTDPADPKYLWEFFGQGTASMTGKMGYSTTGPAIVRVAAKQGSAGAYVAAPDNNRNGKWYAIFASGPTGPIDTTGHQFKGQSDQQLRIFVVDVATGALVRTLESYKDGSGTDVALPSSAFGGSLSTAVIDTDRFNPLDTGYYSDDAVYIGYVQSDTSVTPNTWTKGGVLRLTLKQNTDASKSLMSDPADWTLSKVIDGTGPVTSSITKLQDRNNKLLWLYFGTGRYYYKGDDLPVQQKLYGIKEPCYYTLDRSTRMSMTNRVGGISKNDIDENCTDPMGGTLVDQSGSASTAPAATLSATAPGWVITLDAADTSSQTERVITDPIASTSGAVFFTTFKPSADICKFGGDSLIWAVNYATGGIPPGAAMQGKALMQVSTGAFAEISLSEAFKNPANKRFDGRRLATAISGVPPIAQGLSLITNPPPVKKFLHVREK